MFQIARHNETVDFNDKPLQHLNIMKEEMTINYGNKSVSRYSELLLINTQVDYYLIDSMSYFLTFH